MASIQILLSEAQFFVLFLFQLFKLFYEQMSQQSRVCFFKEAAPNLEQNVSEKEKSNYEHLNV